MKKLHILLVEHREHVIDFFSGALEESGLSFSCSMAGKVEQVFDFFDTILPDAVFININLIKPEHALIMQKLRAMQPAPVIFYSTALTRPHLEKINYVQLPTATSTMARILKNLFITIDVDGPVAVS